MSKVTNIAFIGKRNEGKSSLVNFLLGQDSSIVSDVPGTTADPVSRRMEIFGIGPCNIIDTAGIDDTGELGSKRTKKTYEMLAKVDIAVLIFSQNDFTSFERDMMGKLSELSVPVIILHGHSDLESLDSGVAQELSELYRCDVAEVTLKGLSEQESLEQKELLLSLIVKAFSTIKGRELEMFEGIVSAGDKVLLVCPIDSEAPTGRLILPQVNAIRNLLDVNAMAMVVQPSEVPALFPDGKNTFGFSLVVTDSQAFAKVNGMVPDDIPLTSFSMLLARSKGCFEKYVEGTPKIDSLCDGDRILMLESCTHHSSCEDIGRVKIPALFRKYTGRNLSFDFVSGLDAIDTDIREYAMVVQCGGCMVTSKQLWARLQPAIANGVPVTNYGMAIAYMNGIFDRTVAPLIYDRNAR
ncbi:MAG: [FeFe] hydrogenase H-cluster maturation GTPase HydF [Acetatifactor sp.]